MDIQIYGENLEVTEAINSHIHKKCSKFKNTLTAVNVRLKLDESKHAITKIDVNHNGQHHHITATQKDMYASITEAINKTQQILHKIKSKPEHDKVHQKITM